MSSFAEDSEEVRFAKKMWISTSVGVRVLIPVHTPIPVAPTHPPSLFPIHHAAECAPSVLKEGRGARGRAPPQDGDDAASEKGQEGGPAVEAPPVGRL